MNLEKLDGSKAVHDFPELYNGNNQQLEDEITNLTKTIGDSNNKKSVMGQIAELKSKFNSALNALRAEYLSAISDMKEQIDELKEELRRMEDNQ